jgi:holo-[acyl-carrier protein] synthase
VTPGLPYTGVDLVDVAAFRAQLADPASTFAEATFTAGERRAAARRPSRDPAPHLAARYAAKEAVLKAWSGAHFGRPPQLPRVPLTDIEVVSDAHGRPSITLHGGIGEALRGAHVSVSLSHDGGYAVASVVLVAVG